MEKQKRKRNRVPTGRTAAQAWAALAREPQLLRDNTELKAALRLAHEQRLKLEQAIDQNLKKQVGKRNGNHNIWWAIHNLIAHPLSEIVYWIGLRRLSGWIHDETIPKHDTLSGRG